MRCLEGYGWGNTHLLGWDAGNSLLPFRRWMFNLWPHGTLLCADCAFCVHAYGVIVSTQVLDIASSNDIVGPIRRLEITTHLSRGDKYVSSVYLLVCMPWWEVTLSRGQLCTLAICSWYGGWFKQGNYVPAPGTGGWDERFKQRSL